MSRTFKKQPTHQLYFKDTASAFAGYSNKELRNTYQVFVAMARLPFLIKIPASWLMTAMRCVPLLKKTIKRRLYRYFCGGENIAQSLCMADSLRKRGLCAILDYAVENEKQEKNFDRHREEVTKAIEKAATSSSIPFCVIKLSCLGDTTLMEKKQQRVVLTPEEAHALNRTRQRIDTLCAHASRCGIRLLVDAETYSFQAYVDETVMALMSRYNTQSPVIYNTFQFYLKRTKKNFLSMHAKAKKAGFLLGAKLVRGAYMEKEKKLAKKSGYESPIHDTKEDCDQDFNAALAYCAKHHKSLGICVATHNEYSNYYFTTCMQEANISKQAAHIFFAQLLGMSDNISVGLSAKGYRVAKYVPYGDFEEVIPYLHRRLQENSGVAGQMSKERYILAMEVKRRQL